MLDSAFLCIGASLVSSSPPAKLGLGVYAKIAQTHFIPSRKSGRLLKLLIPQTTTPMSGWLARGARVSVIPSSRPKHHDGYALWDSDYALMGVRQSLGGKCLIAPFVEACHKNDVKVGFYYSGMDWYYDRHYMNYAIGGDTIIDFEGKERDKLPQKPASHVAAFQQFNQIKSKN
jgi:hypothetical protein